MDWGRPVTLVTLGSSPENGISWQAKRGKKEVSRRSTDMSHEDGPWPEGEDNPTFVPEGCGASSCLQRGWLAEARGYSFFY